MPRIEYPDLARLEVEHADLIARIKGERGTLLQLYQLLLNSPTFAEGWLDLGTAVRNKSRLGDRLRELVILRVGRLLQAPYVWTTHVAIARRAGATDDQLAALAEPVLPPIFEAREQVALEYVTVMTERIVVPDDLFAHVAARFSARELLELTITGAFYSCVCRVVGALQLYDEPGFEPAPFEPAG